MQFRFRRRLRSPSSFFPHCCSADNATPPNRPRGKRTVHRRFVKRRRPLSLTMASRINGGGGEEEMGSPIRTPRQATQMQRQNAPSSIFRRPNNFLPRAHVTRIQNRSFLPPPTQPEPLRVRPRPPAHPGARLPRPLIGARSRVPPPGGDADHGRSRRTARSPSARGGGGGHGIARRGAGDLALNTKGLLFLFLFFSFQDPETEAQTKNALVYISVRRR